MIRRERMLRMGAGLAIAMSMVLAITNARAQKTPMGRCASIGDQEDKCLCAKGAKACGCTACTRDEKCACIVAARKAGGSVTGKIKLYRTRVKTKGAKSYKDVVVYLEKVGKEGDFPPPPSPARLDQKGLVFIPHVLAVQKGRTIELLNNDNDKHNVYLLYDLKTGKTETKNLGTWKPGVTRTHVFKEPKVVTALCKLHLEMAAYFVVLDNPFFTVAKIDGKSQVASFTIKNIPPGKYRLNAWHKRLKLKTGPVDVVVEAGKAAKADLTITKSKYVAKK
ncbi:hypothetical protein LCGC14_2208450 [marine sediment metagenome]|uniref:Uncharacterized protein n=1 Tax=marine sediment metagenome TaxID=412755 RepID=A0A0F9FRV3_9ZZZZ